MINDDNFKFVQGEIPLLDLMLEEAERYLPFCKEKNHYKDARRVKFICLGKEKDCINVNHGVCQDCMLDRWICNGHQFMNITDFIKIYQDNVEQAKRTMMSDADINFQNLEYLSRVPTSLQDLMQMKGLIVKQKEIINQLEDKIVFVINQLIKIRAQILPQEVDLAKNFYSHRIFNEVLKEESSQSANAMEILKKKSADNLDNFNRMFEYLIQKLPINYQKLVSRQRAGIDQKESFRKFQVFDIPFDFDYCYSHYKKIDQEASKLFMDNQGQLQSNLTLLSNILEDINQSEKNYQVVIDRLAQEHHDVTPLIINEFFESQNKERLPTESIYNKTEESENPEFNVSNLMRKENMSGFMNQVYDKELMLIFNDQDAFIEKKAYNELDDGSWIPSEFLKFKQLAAKYGFMLCETREQTEALKNFGNLERITQRSKVVIVLKRSRNQNVQDVLNSLVQFLKSLRVNFFGIYVFINVATYLRTPKPQDFTGVLDMFTLLQTFQLITLDISTYKFEQTNQFFLHILKERIKIHTLEIILNQHCLRSRIFDSILQVSQATHILEINLIFRFDFQQMNEGQALFDLNETLSESLELFSSFLSRSLPSINGLSVQILSPIKNHHFNKLFEAISNFNILNIMRYLTLYFVNSGIDQNGGAVLEIRDLQKQNINSNVEVCSGLGKLTQATLQTFHLNIQQNNISNHGMKAFNRLFENKCMRGLRDLQLNLSNNFLGNAGASILCTSVLLVSEGLQHLYLNLADNSIDKGSRGAMVSLMEQLEQTTKTITVKLNNNDLEDEFIQDFMLTIQKMGITYTDDGIVTKEIDLTQIHLNFGDNPKLTAMTIDYIMKAFDKGSTNLQNIYLNLRGIPLNMALHDQIKKFRRVMINYRKVKIVNKDLKAMRLFEGEEQIGQVIIEV